MTIEELIGALEKAAVGGRKLDAAITVALGASPHKHDYQSALGCGCAPPYTTSLDAALSIRREKPLSVRLWHDARPGFGSVSFIDCRVVFDLAREPWHLSGNAATFPLAICAALLRDQINVQPGAPP